MNGSEGVTNSEVVIGDIYREFMAAVEIFSAAEKVRWPQFFLSLYIFYIHIISTGPTQFRSRQPV